MIRYDSIKYYKISKIEENMLQKPGERIESRCTRCKDIMGHIIVSMLDGEIAKVECCACGSVHKYYPAIQKKEKKQERTLRVRAGEERTSAVKEKSVRTARIAHANSNENNLAQRSVSGKVTIKTVAKGGAKLAEELQQKWREAIAKNPSTPLPYSMTSEFSLAQLIEHKNFGVGMIIAVYPPDKVDILFEEGVKSLRCLCK